MLWAPLPSVSLGPELKFTELEALENPTICACSYPHFSEEETKAQLSFNHITYVHFSTKTVWLKTTGIILSGLWKLEVQNQSIGPAMLSMKAVGQNQ